MEGGVRQVAWEAADRCEASNRMYRNAVDQLYQKNYSQLQFEVFGQAEMETLAAKCQNHMGEFVQRIPGIESKSQVFELCSFYQFPNFRAFIREQPGYREAMIRISDRIRVDSNFAKKLSSFEQGWDKKSWFGKSLPTLVEHFHAEAKDALAFSELASKQKQEVALFRENFDAKTAEAKIQEIKNLGSQAGALETERGEHEKRIFKI